jgi:hypothetical protein
VTVEGNRLEDRVTATQAAAANIGKVVRTATV